ncbi:hypothetical protein Sjap_005747 [Stephania japonica]|uniref:Nudix hydrolase domain-containing protein n=1 Tax=Stephania japonica TaxID=461633 RepID=A0AAP0K651_9MAGN
MFSNKPPTTPPPSPPQQQQQQQQQQEQQLLRLRKHSSLTHLFSTLSSLLFIQKSPINLKISQTPLRNLFTKLKTPTTMHPPPQNPTFPSPQSLSDWLKPRLPSASLAAWGASPGTKNIHNLWLELSQGETSLIDSTPPIRTVNVVTVTVISPDGRNLIEVRQELSDGSARDRGRPLSEKMKPGETVEGAVMRAVREELGLGGIIDEGVVRIVPGSYRKRVEERASASYPGLPASYVLHSVDAWVEGLPEGDFSTEEGEEYGDCDEAARVAEKAVFVKKHYWKWISTYDDSGSSPH